MSQPLIVTQLLLKRAEIEAQIKSLEDRLGQARADRLHIAATVRLFDPTAIDRPATVYHGATKAMRRSDVFALCKAALEASPEPLCTRRLARHVITAEGWDQDDTRLRLAISHEVGATMKRMSLREAVRKVEERQKASVWRLTGAPGAGRDGCARRCGSRDGEVMSSSWSERQISELNMNKRASATNPPRGNRKCANFRRGF